MRTTINIPEEMLKEIKKIYGEKNNSRAIRKALEDIIKLSNQQKILELFGKVEFELDYKEIEKMREGRI